MSSTCRCPSRRSRSPRDGCTRAEFRPREPSRSGSSTLYAAAARSSRENARDEGCPAGKAAHWGSRAIDDLGQAFVREKTTAVVLGQRSRPGDAVSFIAMPEYGRKSRRVLGVDNLTRRTFASGGSGLPPKTGRGRRHRGMATKAVCWACRERHPKAIASRSRRAEEGHAAAAGRSRVPTARHGASPTRSLGDRSCREPRQQNVEHGAQAGQSLFSSASVA